DVRKVGSLLIDRWVLPCDVRPTRSGRVEREQISHVLVFVEARRLVRFPICSGRLFPCRHGTLINSNQVLLQQLFGKARYVLTHFLFTHVETFRERNLNVGKSQTPFDQLPERAAGCVKEKYIPSLSRMMIVSPSITLAAIPNSLGQSLCCVFTILL